ncbi:hypothetical protein NPIL_324381 [Nephila pilipes]|uniref:Uncharacterized protein n=1 Tax=Nephila pilipes TaxID=299642 RepID=A0A8X6U7C4_NEPPI|nr:hypothetical protein NPIL_324381 [Nephila pilipes]
MPIDLSTNFKTQTRRKPCQSSTAEMQFLTSGSLHGPKILNYREFKSNGTQSQQQRRKRETQNHFLFPQQTHSTKSVKTYGGIRRNLRMTLRRCTRISSRVRWYTTHLQM